jgi:hypothetical protein
MKEIDFCAETHIYRVSGKVVPSVTKIVAEGGFYPVGIRPETVSVAMDKGTKVHKTFALHNQDNLVMETLHPVLKNYLTQYQDFRKRFPFEIVAQETAIYSAKLNVAGTPDLIIQKGKDLGIIEIKTGAMNHKYTAVQTAGYAEIYPEKIKLRIGVEIGEFIWQVKEFTDTADRQAFLACLALFNYKLRGKL